MQSGTFSWAETTTEASHGIMTQDFIPMNRFHKHYLTFPLQQLSREDIITVLYFKKKLQVSEGLSYPHGTTASTQPSSNWSPHDTDFSSHAVCHLTSENQELGAVQAGLEIANLWGKKKKTQMLFML